MVKKFLLYMEPKDSITILMVGMITSHSVNHSGLNWQMPVTGSHLKPEIVCISYFSHTCYMVHSSHPPWFGHPNILWRYELWISWICVFFSHPVTFFWDQIFTLAPFSNTPSVSLGRETKFCTHTGKTTEMSERNGCNLSCNVTK